MHIEALSYFEQENDAKSTKFISQRKLHTTENESQITKITEIIEKKHRGDSESFRKKCQTMENDTDMTKNIWKSLNSLSETTILDKKTLCHLRNSSILVVFDENPWQPLAKPYFLWKP